MEPALQLEKAVKSGDVLKVLAVLEEHPETIDSRGGLWTAVFEGDREIIELLLDRGADVNARHAARDFGFGTPLLVAATLGHSDTAELLAARGATMDIFAHTAMGHRDVVDRMLSEDPAAMGREYGTGHPTIELHPISFAHCCGTDEMYRVFVKHGATIDFMQVWNAVNVHNHAAIQFLLERFDWREDASAQAAFVGAAAGEPTTLELILKLGVDLNAQAEGNGEHAGHFHVRKASFEPFVLLLESGIALDAQRKDGATMLHIAARMGLIRFAEQLLDRGARHDILDFPGTRRTKLREPATALDYARARKNPKMAEFLEARTL